MSVLRERIIAMLMLIVPTPRDRSTVPVIRDTQGMESRVTVSLVLLEVEFTEIM